MQIIDDSWVLRAQEIAEKRKEIIPPRGVVFDRNNKIISIPAILSNELHR